MCIQDKTTRGCEGVLGTFQGCWWQPVVLDGLFLQTSLSVSSCDGSIGQVQEGESKNSYGDIKCLKYMSLVCGAQIVRVTTLISGYRNSEDSDHPGMNYCKEQNDCLKTRKCVCGPRSFSIISLFPPSLYCLLPPKYCR